MLTKSKISREVADVLELPYGHREGKAHDIVTCVLKVITDALLRGETVHVQGFGILSIWERKPVKRNASYFLAPRTKPYFSEVVVKPAKRYVHFQPAEPLIRSINES